MRTLLALAVLATLTTAADAADEAARVAARAVITLQVEALGRDDAQTAYDQAAPTIREMFPTPEIFLGMVRSNYTAVYRHRSFVFGPTQDVGDTGLSQDVAIQDAYGIDWTASYNLERQADGGWRITGCRLTKLPGTSL